MTYMVSYSAQTIRLLPLVFFFSSRRRHTRCSRDWSSDVCSSDLRSTFPHAPSPGSSESAASAPHETHSARGARSEEHTSELQSRLHLVCRLLLEKKNLGADVRVGAGAVVHHDGLVLRLAHVLGHE